MTKTIFKNIIYTLNYFVGDIMGDTKGSFLDMLKNRFRKIKLFFKNKLIKELKEHKEKIKNDKLKRKKEEELIFINLNRNIKNNNKKMIIPKENKIKKHLGINIIKVLLVPTTLILTAFKNNNKDIKKSSKKENQTNLQKKLKSTDIKQENVVNTQKVEQNQNCNKDINKNLQDIKVSTNKNKENKDISLNAINMGKNSTIKKKLTKKNKGVANIFNPKKLNNKLILIKLDFKKYKKINNELEKKLEEQKTIYEEFNKKIKNITPEKRVHIKYYFINNLLHNFKNILLVALSIPLLKKPKNVPLFAVGLYIANNSIRNMRKLITKEEKIEYIPSKNYVGAIKNNLYGLELVEYMLEDSLEQLEQLEIDFIDKFSIYKDSDSFKNNINEIRKYKSQLKKKSEKLEIQKEKMNSTMEKNQKVLTLIKDMNS